MTDNKDRVSAINQIAELVATIEDIDFRWEETKIEGMSLFVDQLIGILAQFDIEISDEYRRMDPEAAKEFVSKCGFGFAEHGGLYYQETHTYDQETLKWVSDQLESVPIPIDPLLKGSAI